MAFDLKTVLSFSSRGLSTFGPINKSLDKFTTRIKRAGAQTHSIGMGMRNIGIIGSAMAAGVGVSVNSWLEFEKQMDSAKAKLADGEQYASELEATTKMLGRTTVYTAKEAAQGLEYLALAGFKSRDAIGVLPTILKVAAAGAMDLGRASDIVTDSMAAMNPVMKQYGDKAAQAIKLSDVFAEAQRTTNTNIEQLGEAVKFGGAALADLGIPIHEIVGMMGTLANSALKGSIGGTALMNMFNKLSAPTEKAKEMMEAAGFSTEDFIDQDTGKLKSVADIVHIVSKAADDAGHAFERGAFLAEVFGIRGKRGILPLINEADQLQERFDNLAKSQGSAADQYTKMTDNLWGVFKAFQSAVSGISIEVGKFFTQAGGFEQFGKAITDPLIKIGDALDAINTPMKDWTITQLEIMQSDLGLFLSGMSDGFHDVADAVTNSINWFKNLGQEFKDSGIDVKEYGRWLGIIGTTLVVVGPLIMGLGLALFILTPIVTGAAGAFGLLGTVLGLLFSPIGIVIGLIALAGALIFYFMGGIEGITEAWSTFTKGFMEEWSPIWKMLKEEMQPSLDILFETFDTIWTQLFGNTSKAANDFTGFGRKVAWAAGAIVQALLPVIDIGIWMLDILAKITVFGIDKMKDLMDWVGIGGGKIQTPNKEKSGIMNHKRDKMKVFNDFLAAQPKFTGPRDTAAEDMSILSAKEARGKAALANIATGNFGMPTLTNPETGEPVFVVRTTLDENGLNTLIERGKRNALVKKGHQSSFVDNPQTAPSF